TRFLCTRTLLNDLEYVDYSISSTSTTDAHESRCGAGDWYDNEWFDGSKAGSTLYETNDALPEALRLKPDLASATSIVNYRHSYNEGDKPILVLVDGHSTNAITHKINFVPAVKNVGFDTVQMPVEQGGYVVGFDVEQILQSNLDPIVTYRWDFGDGSEVLETSSALVEHVYAEGSFTVTLTVVTQAGIETTVSQTVEVGERLRTP
ncbi:PKD domain-containing protein, partial [Vibrio cholerae]|uniref:PKD domain-containing protein n=1 Tax=Vibrio cholerae TaxID=666 RepID=UPI0018F07C4B